MKAKTVNCGRYQHPEFVIEYDASVVIEPDINWLIVTIETMVASGTKFDCNETIRIGWSEAMVGNQDSICLHLLEPDWSGALPIKYVPGVTHSLSQLRQQTAVADSLDLTEHLLFPLILAKRDYLRSR